MARSIVILALSTVVACGGGPSDVPDSPDATPSPDARIPGTIVVERTQIGSPTWEIVDVQNFVAPMGTGYSSFAEWEATLESVLPHHTFYTDLSLLGPDPAEPHAPPYDGELTAGLAASGFTSSDQLTEAAWTAPGGLTLAAMMVPIAGAPTGSSPDFASGPIIANSQFPILVEGDVFLNGAVVDEYFDTSYPMLAEIPIVADGYSHMPLTFGEGKIYIPGDPGAYRWRVWVRDATGAGWIISVGFWVI